VLGGVPRLGLGLGAAEEREEGAGMYEQLTLFPTKRSSEFRQDAVEPVGRRGKLDRSGLSPACWRASMRVSAYLSEIGVQGVASSPPRRMPVPLELVATIEERSVKGDLAARRIARRRLARGSDPGDVIFAIDKEPGFLPISTLAEAERKPGAGPVGSEVQAHFAARVPAKAGRP